MALDITLDPSEAMRRFRVFAFGPECPEDLANRLQTIPGSEADALCVGADMLYAHYDLLPDAGRIVMAQLFAFASTQTWSQYNLNDRCKTIVQLVRHDLGEQVDSPAELPEPVVAHREGNVDWRNIDNTPPLPEPLPTE